MAFQLFDQKIVVYRTHCVPNEGGVFHWCTSNHTFSSVAETCNRWILQIGKIEQAEIKSILFDIHVGYHVPTCA